MSSTWDICCQAEELLRVDAVQKMPAPTTVSSLRSFLGSVQFMLQQVAAQSVHTFGTPVPADKKNYRWIKSLLCEDTVLAHFDPFLPIGIACDASNVGIGAVIFHRYEDGSERPVANASKTLSETQRNYIQMQKEALSIVFALRKFHHFLYGWKILFL